MFRWLISTVGLAMVKGEVTAMAQRAARRGALFVAVLMLWLVALGFGVAAFTVWLATVVGIIWALVIDAGIFALIGLTIQVALMMTARRPAQPVSPLAGLTGSADGAGGGNLLGSLAIVAVLGWLLGRQTSGDKK